MSNLPAIENPFTPTFGEVPAHMAGRSVLLNDLRRAFSSTKRHPNLTTAITGARGTGKTTLLSLAANEAERYGWIAVKTVAIEGMLNDILISARRAASHLLDVGGKPRLSGIEIGQMLAMEWERTPELTNWRNEMTLLLDQLEASETGLLIVVDEVQPKLSEMIELAAVYQLFVMEERKVALLMAGLPHNMLLLESDKTVSFLRRAQKHQLGRIPDYDIRDAMLRTIEDSGRTIDPEILDELVAAADGFPFMMQLVGFRTWDQNPDAVHITAKDAEKGVALANEEFRERIVKVTYDGLSAGDRAFLKAMLEDGEASTIKDIAQRLGKTNSYVTQYKNRLLGQGVIEEAAGKIRFQLPLMREYVSNVCE